MAVCSFSMITRQQYQQVLRAFRERSQRYWQEHPQELHDTLLWKDHWDGFLWSKAVHLFLEGDWNHFTDWLCYWVTETHVRDQMLALIKRVGPRVYYEYGLNRHD